MMTGQRVCVTIVSYNSRRYIGSCLESVLQQSGAPIEVVVVDNASSDSTREILGRYRHRVRVIYNARNVGFAAAQNQAMAASADFFDPDFFVYREDADVAWRAQLLGWRAIYTPGAVAWHVRSVLPGNRLAVPAAINMHSVKNRFLMRIKNMTPDLYRRYWL